MDALFQLFRLCAQNLLRLGRGLSAQGGGQFFDLFGERLRVVDQRLHSGREGQLLNGFRAALRLQVKQGERVDLIAPVFQAHGIGGVRREDVQDAAALGELPGAVDLRSALITAGDQRGDHLFHGDALPGGDRDGALAQLLRRDRILQGRVQAGDHRVALAVQDAR